MIPQALLRAKFSKASAKECRSTARVLVSHGDLQPLALVKTAVSQSRSPCSLHGCRCITTPLCAVDCLRRMGDAYRRWIIFLLG